MITVYSCANSYIDLVETYIERRLKEAFPGFEMDAFMQQLQQHEQEMDGSDVLEVLLSFGDFPTFKDIMLSYKTEMAGSMFHVDVRIDPTVDPNRAKPAKPKKEAATDRGEASPDDENTPSRSSIDIITSSLGGTVISESPREA